ncbi:MAG: LLM class flavin-dependent oxidoreductase [Actinobacteria bacterium]|nr:LLM class flavin-dependent oxidoreductase [Actinomycetota bacterium]
MQVGVGLPANVPGTPGATVVEWARAADQTPLSTLAVIDRIAYGNYEPLVALAACAGVTARIRLATTVLVAPIRHAGLLAKQTASIDALSGGRLTVGFGIGGREEDYLAAGSRVDFHSRADHFEEQLEVLRRVWSGQPPVEGVAGVGPPPRRPGGPEVLIGGYSPRAARRAGRLADGFIAGALPPARARELFDEAVAAWRDAARAGKPRFVGCAYWALGDGATVERGRDVLRDYYAFAGERAEGIAEQMLASTEQVRDRLGAAADVGMDEVILWPCVAELSQLHRLSELVGEWEANHGRLA